MSSLRSAGALVATMVVAVAGCDATSPTAPPNAGGQFTATVSGAASAQFSGAATSTGGGTPAGFNIQLRGADGVSAIVLVRDGQARPNTGPQPIASTAEHGGNAPNGEFTALLTIAGPTVFGSVNGTLTIDASSPGSVSGRFTFTAEDPSDPTQTVTVDGAFDTTNQDLP